MTKDTRSYVAAAVFMVATLGIGYVLMVYEINSTNRDLVVSLLAVATSGAGIAIGKLFGTATDDQVAKLQKAFNELELKHQTLQHEYGALVRMLVDRHIIQAQGFERAENCPAENCPAKARNIDK
jgi:hypothetical protein